MGIVKAFRFASSAHWRGGRLARASAPGKPPLDVAVPPEFKGVAGLWSPEELLAAAAASCFTVTLAAVAEHAEAALLSIDVDGTAHVERTEDGRFVVTLVELAVDVGSDEDAATIERLLAEAKRRCIVTLALGVPVHVRLAALRPVGVAVSR